MNVLMELKEISSSGIITLGLDSSVKKNKTKKPQKNTTKKTSPQLVLPPPKKKVKKTFLHETTSESYQKMIK